VRELCFLDAAELAAMLRAKEVSARDVMAAQLEQIARVNPSVNAIVTLVAEQAMADAARADEALARGESVGPLHGLPVAHKDLFATKGIRTTLGSPIFRDHVPDADAAIVARAKAAGAITVGKTNTPEFGLGSQTFNPVFGQTLNPYDLSKTCGGSSGGAAVALACGMVPLADGSDTGGSLRNPANFCNVVGLRSSPGRVPAGPGTWSPLNVAGPMGRSVRDVALFLSCLAGPSADSPLSITEDPAKFASPLERDFRGAGIAFSPDLGGLPVDPRVRDVLAGAAQVFRDLGAEVEEASPDFTGAEHVFQTLRAVGMVSQYGELLKTHRDQMKATAIWNIEKGLALTGEEVGRAQRLHAELFVRMQRFMSRYEFLVCPVNQVPPFDVTTEYPEEIAGVRMTNYIDWMRSCWYITVTAHPAISVPAGFTPDGLPVGLQIVGRYRDEFGVLQLAAAFEAATQHGKRRPAVAL
jgi:amidase